MANKDRKAFGAALIALCLLFVFGYRCPFQFMTGIPCPGCNFTTALLFLLQGNLETSLWYHAMVIPTLLLALVSVPLFAKRKRKALEILWIVWGVTMIVYYAYRMVTIFPDVPMVYDKMSLAGKLFH